ncbi:hypothetical protein NPIL_497301 [Nephila pilipes]|uniref:Uncharacterized protein n=1 Tax=Nephila pilipes TaxID=299642 RepID=A0A8X6U180_NEPPI|nr:hypothetical protein NPIL_497301 [Nephila pilipes]
MCKRTKKKEQRKERSIHFQGKTREGTNFTHLDPLQSPMTLLPICGLTLITWLSLPDPKNDVSDTSEKRMFLYMFSHSGCELMALRDKCKKNKFSLEIESHENNGTIMLGISHFVL